MCSVLVCVATHPPLTHPHTHTHRLHTPSHNPSSTPPLTHHTLLHSHPSCISLPSLTHHYPPPPSPLTNTQAELRGSLVLSMLKQMLTEDKAESVRQAVARSLGVIVAFTDDESKFVSCWELLLKAITDPSQLVVSTTYSVLLPALAAWSFELGTLEKDLLSYFLHQLLTCVKVSLSDICFVCLFTFDISSWLGHCQYPI